MRSRSPAAPGSTCRPRSRCTGCARRAPAACRARWRRRRRRRGAAPRRRRARRRCCACACSRCASTRAGCQRRSAAPHATSATEVRLRSRLSRRQSRFMVIQCLARSPAPVRARIAATEAARCARRPRAPSSAAGAPRVAVDAVGTGALQRSAAAPAPHRAASASAVSARPACRPISSRRVTARTPACASNRLRGAVVLGRARSAAAAAPRAIQLARHALQAGAVAAVVAEQHDVRESRARRRLRAAPSSTASNAGAGTMIVPA